MNNGEHQCSDPQCIVCQEGRARVDRWHEEQMEKHGWYYHAVFGEAKPEFPTGFNAHTHGLPDKYNHRDFELVFPFQKKISQVIGSIFWNFAKRIEGGERFESNQEVSEIIRNFNIKLIPAYRDDEKVLRIILPDAEGKLNESELHGDFAMQYHHAKEF